MKNAAKTRRDTAIGFSYLHLMAGYVFVTFVIFSVTLLVLHRLTTEGSLRQTADSVGLIAEKMDSSIDMMGEQTMQIASLLDAQGDHSLQQCYDELQLGIAAARYLSAGLVDAEGKVYGKPGEQLDIDKYDFPAEAAAKGGLYITEPYRSSVTGGNVLTMFYPFSRDDAACLLFVTYPLTVIQDLARSNNMDQGSEIFLMNPFSGNFITCSSGEHYAAGTWSNIRLLRNSYKSLAGYDYEAWEDLMRKGAARAAVCYEAYGAVYTQAFENITNMQDWYVVVRIPTSYLSVSPTRYSRVFIISATLLMAASLTIAALIYRKETAQKKLLQQLSAVDPLTQIMNRRAFDEVANAHLQNADAGRRSVLMFADIDYFKHINDTLGHACGDRVLHHFAEQLKVHFPSHSLIARVGGDEFIVFLKLPPSRAVLDKKLEDLQTALSHTTLPEFGALKVQCSIGLAQSPADASDLENLKKCADAALYHVKQNGRGRYCWHGDLTAQK